MSEQENGKQGAIPPKVSPFAKPEGAAPITPAGAPRPLTAIRIKPRTPAGAPPAPAAKTPAAVNPKATSRVPLPDAAGAAPRPVTVRLRPLAPPAADAPAATVKPGSTQMITQVELSATAPIAPVTPLPQSPPVPGSSPLPDGVKPPSQAQVQAAKSKTSRISLDAAIGAAPAADGPKTIRLKRPSNLPPPAAPAQAAARKTSRIPDSALPTADDSAAVTQKKTLKIKRPGTRPETATESAEATEDMQLTPISSLDYPAPQSSPAFTAIAVICAALAAVVLVMLTLCLGAHAIGPDAGRNSLASIPGPELPWPGRL